MENEKRYIFNIISSVLRGSSSLNLTDDLDFAILFDIADKQSVTNILCEGLKGVFLPEKTAAAQKEIIRKQKKAYTDYIILLEALCEKGVECLPVGGVALRGLYGEPTLRESRDFDILIRESDRESAISVAEKLSYTHVRECRNCDYLYKAPDTRIAIRTDYFGLHIWCKAKAQSHCFYALIPEDRYICALYILEKSLDENKGQLRQLTDIFALKFSFDQIFNKDYLNSEMKYLDLAEFEEKITNIYHSLFLMQENIQFDESIVNGLFEDFPRKLPPKYMSPEKAKSIMRIKNALYIIAAISVLSLIAAMVVFFDNGFAYIDSPVSEISVSAEESLEEASEESKPFTSYNDCLFYGEIKNGLPEGHGRMEYTSGDVFEGSFVDGIKEGYGVMYFRSGGRYEGNFTSGYPCDAGTMYYPNGDVLSGNFVNWSNDWRASGSCIYKKKCDDGYDTYEGTITDGKLDGKWKITYSDGDVYNGQLENGERSGEGTYIWKSDAQTSPTFVGTWKSNAMYEGTFTDEYGKYTGTFYNDKFSGEGKYVYSSGDTYTGNFKNGLADDDEAELKYKKGGKYVGAFKKGVFEGKGTMYRSNGDKVTGIFVNGKLEGDAQYFYHEQGVWQTVVYKNGEIIKYKDIIK